MAVKVALDPAQTVCEFTDTVGIGFTVIVPDPAKLEQPVNVYTTEYVVVEEGETVNEVPVEVLLHKYVPPEAEEVAVKVALAPLQIVNELTVTVGTELTVTVPDADKPGQPKV